MNRLLSLTLFVCTPAIATATEPPVELLDFTADYCGPCQQMVPLLQRMEQDHFPIRRIDITVEHEMSRRYRVDRIPTLVLLVEGREVQRFVGLTSEAELRSAMNREARKLHEARENVAGAIETLEPTRSADAAVVQNSGTSAEPDGRMSLAGLFSRLLPGRGEEPAVRGQSPEPEALTGLKAASAATVRVRVVGQSTKDGKTLQDVGTGTIVHCETGRALVLTCAHLFLDIRLKDAAIDVEVFEDGKPARYPAKVVGGDHNSDLAILSIQTAKSLPIVMLTSQSPALALKQPLTTFGCNNGDDPTQMETSLVEINRWDGPDNLTCSGDPTSGRSGGGLFNAAGELVGVCSCADRKRSEGLYMAYGAIHQLLTRYKLTSILSATPSGSGDDTSNLMNELAQGAPAPRPVSPQTPRPESRSPMGPETESAPPSRSDSGTAIAGNDSFGVGNLTTDLTDAPLFDPQAEADRLAAASPATSSAAAGPEITIMIDDKSPGSEKRVIIIPRATPWLMEMLTGEAEPAANATAALRPVVPAEWPTARPAHLRPASSQSLAP